MRKIYTTLLQPKLYFIIVGVLFSFLHSAAQQTGKGVVKGKTADSLTITPFSFSNASFKPTLVQVLQSGF